METRIKNQNDEEEAIKKMKERKATGVDEIPTEC